MVFVAVSLDNRLFHFPTNAADRTDGCSFSQLRAVDYRIISYESRSINYGGKAHFCTSTDVNRSFGDIQHRSCFHSCSFTYI